jgi:hypothetical protein
VCLPAIGAMLAVAIGLGHPTQGIVAVVGAVTAGFGSFRQVTQFRAVPMVLAVGGMAISAWVGSLAGGANLICVVAVSAVWGLGFGVYDAGQGRLVGRPAMGHRSFRVRRIPGRPP